MEQGATQDNVNRSLQRLALSIFNIKHHQWIFFFVLTALILRLTLALTHAPYLGIDGGAYILSALDVQGKQITDVGFPRPPLAPGWLLVPFINFLGVDIGYKVWAVLFSFMPFLPIYFLTRDLVNRATAAFAVGFFSVDVMQMEMLVTGSLPLIGFSCIGMAIWAVFRLSQGYSRPASTVLIVSVGILPYINQTAAGIGVIVLPLITLSLFFFSPKEYRREALRNTVIAACFGGFIALGSLPWYFANAPGNSELRFPGPWLMLVNWRDPALLLQFPIVAFLVYTLLREGTDPRIKATATTLAVLGGMILFLSYDESIINVLYRSRYFLAILVYPAIGFWLRNIFPLKPSFKEEVIVIAPMALMWVILLVTQVWVFHTQSHFKDMVFPETVEALSLTENDQAIITNAYSLSHWVAALNQVESPNTWSLEPSPFYLETDGRVRCILGWVDGCDPEQASQALDAGYVLIDERMPDEIKSAPIYGAPSENEWDNLPTVPWLKLLYSKGTVKLWEIKF